MQRQTQEKRKPGEDSPVLPAWKKPTPQLEEQAQKEKERQKLQEEQARRKAELAEKERPKVEKAARLTAEKEAAHKPKSVCANYRVVWPGAAGGRRLGGQGCRIRSTDW